MQIPRPCAPHGCRMRLWQSDQGQHGMDHTSCQVSPMQVIRLCGGAERCQRSGIRPEKLFKPQPFPDGSSIRISSGRFMRGKALQETSMTSFSLTLPTWESRPCPAPDLGRSRQRHINENRVKVATARGPLHTPSSPVSYDPDLGGVMPLLYILVFSSPLPPLPPSIC